MRVEQSELQSTGLRLAKKSRVGHRLECNADADDMRSHCILLLASIHYFAENRHANRV